MNEDSKPYKKAYSSICLKCRELPKENVSNPTVSRATQGPDSYHGDDNDAKLSASNAPNGSESDAPDPLKALLLATREMDTPTAIVVGFLYYSTEQEKRFQKQLAQQFQVQHALLQLLVSKVVDSIPSTPAPVPAQLTPVQRVTPRPKHSYYHPSY